MSVKMAETAGRLTAEGTSRFVQTKKWKLHYHEAGSGYPIIMLHGGGPGAGGWTNFSGNLAELSKKYRVILLDFPGFNLSDELDPSNQARQVANAEAVKLLMDELGIERAALVGNSMGGMATLMFTALFGDRISHCITMGVPAPAGPATFFSPGGGLSEGLKILMGAYRDPSPESFKKLVSVMVYDDSFATDELAQERSRQALSNPRHLENFLKTQTLTNQTPSEVLTLGERLTETKTPALVIHGRDDRVVSVENGLRISSLLQNSSLLVFNRCGHWAQIEHVQKFNAIVDAFVGSVTK